MQSNEMVMDLACGSFDLRVWINCVLSDVWISNSLFWFCLLAVFLLPFEDLIEFWLVDFSFLFLDASDSGYNGDRV